MNIPFVKMHGIGNDFILLKRQDFQDASKDGDLARKICQRHFGIGADGMMVADISGKADVKMLYYNADGSQGEMCGNGIRCFAHYVLSEKLVPYKSVLRIQTLLDVRDVEIQRYAQESSVVKVYMGTPEVRSLGKTMVLDEVEIELADLTVGVPHVVLVESELCAQKVNTLGPKIEKMDCFPQGTNVNFVKIHDRGCLSVMTWERGAGHTLACGTGICSVCSFLHQKGQVEDKIDVMAEGGSLTIEIDNDNGIYMTGPSIVVARGNYLLHS